MRNPLRGVVTSEHEDDGGYRKHRGRDIGTRDLNNLLMPVWVYGVGKPVYAAFSGWWVDIVRWSKPGSRSSTWAPTRTGNGGYIRNPDGEAQGYNHVAVLSKWSEGDWIEEGDLIGHLDLSGNMSAPHLHFETWANWRDPYSDFSPKILFDKYGVDTMDDPATATRTDGATITPAATTPKESPLSAAEVNQIKAHITAEVDGLYDRLITAGGLSWAKVGHNGENLRQLLWEAAKGAQAGYINTNAIKNTNTEVVKAIATVAQYQGLTPEQVSALIDATAKAASEGAEKGASEAVEAGVTVDITATTTANRKEG